MRASIAALSACGIIASVDFRKFVQQNHANTAKVMKAAQLQPD
jgi:hypothetical protein